MKLAAIAILREITRLKYEAAAAIRERLARSEAEVEGWNENGGNARVWEVIRRGDGDRITRASIEMARVKALHEVKARASGDGELAAEIVLLNAVFTTAAAIVDALIAVCGATRGDPDEIVRLVKRARSADELRHEARFKLGMLDAAADVRATLHEALSRVSATLCDHGLDRREAEQSIREIVFEDER